MKYRKKVITITLFIIAAATALALFSAYMTNKTYSVTFYSDDNAVLKIDTVKLGDSALPPVEPQVTYGKVFLHWDCDITKVREDLAVYPVCEEIAEKTNVFAMSGAYGKKDDSVYIPLTLCGNVCVAGVELVVEYDPGKLELESVYDIDGAVLCNSETPGKILLNFVSAYNSTGDMDLCSFKFKIITDDSSVPVVASVDKLYAFDDADALVEENGCVVNANVYILP